MHRKVLKLIAAVCSTTVSLYVFIAFSPHAKSYQKTYYDYNKYEKQVFVSDSTLKADDKCCQWNVDTTLQSVSSLVSNDKYEKVIENSEHNLSLEINQFINKTIDKKVKSSEDYKDYKYCDLHLAMIFTITQNTNNSNKNRNSIDKKLYRSLNSILKYKNHLKVCVHLITDTISRFRAKSIIKIIGEKSSSDNEIMFHFHDIIKANAVIQYLLPSLKSHFSYKPNSYYSHSLFFLSVAIHKFFTTIDKIIFLDIDIQFNENISQLYSLFSAFSSDAIIGIAYEQQPVYRHILNDYRRKVNNETSLGCAPPNGWPGFNSGVLLMNLKRMRNSKLYNNLINSQTIDRLCKKYLFRGHLGDQDFYTVLSFQYKQLFHVIPCNWNRQLCQWWRYHGYRDVFDLYFKCDLKINLFHGNCNSVLPMV